MSLLTIIKEASDQIGLPNVAQVIGNPEKDIRQLLSLVTRGGDLICETTNGSGGSWSVLERIHEFQTAASQQEYAIPTDFQKFIVGTAWQKDKYWHMRGSVTPQQWQRIRNRQTKTPFNVFRLLRTQASGGAGAISTGNAANKIRKFQVEPPPGDAITLVYEYVSRNWWISADGATYKRRPTADDDESLFGDGLHIVDAVWRWKSANGLDFAADLAEFEMRRDRLLVQDEAAEFISVGYDRRVWGNKDESDLEWGFTP